MEWPKIEWSVPREQATKLAEALQLEIEPDWYWQEPSHWGEGCFLGLALQERLLIPMRPADQISIPPTAGNHEYHYGRQPADYLILIAIYCYVARRLGINAVPCVFRSTLIVAVLPKYIDGHLERAVLIEPGTTSSKFYSIFPHDNPPQQVSTQEMVIDFGKTLTSRASYWAGHKPVPLAYSQEFPSMASATYCADWAHHLFQLPAQQGQSPMSHVRCNRLESEHAIDVGLIEDHYTRHDLGLAPDDDPLQLTRHIRVRDETPLPIESRGGGRARAVRFRVGQLVRREGSDRDSLIVGWSVRPPEYYPAPKASRCRSRAPAAD